MVLTHPWWTPFEANQSSDPRPCGATREAPRPPGAQQQRQLRQLRQRRERRRPTELLPSSCRTARTARTARIARTARTTRNASPPRGRRLTPPPGERTRGRAVQSPHRAVSQLPHGLARGGGPMEGGPNQRAVEPRAGHRRSRCRMTVDQDRITPRMFTTARMIPRPSTSRVTP